jgi:predicted nucleic acid-binding protein
MKIYLDACCLNRPFDDQTQDRIRLESEAILLILARVEDNRWDWFSSNVVDHEIAQTPDPKRRERITLLVAHAHHSMIIGDNEIERAKELEKMGFGDMDALHIACAEHLEVDIFLSTDDKLIRCAVRMAKRLHVAVDNPLTWLANRRETDTK